MTHFLRNKKNQTIISCDVGNDDLSSAIDIEIFSVMLIDQYNLNEHAKLIREFSDLDEIRGWWWEQAKDSGEYESIDMFVKEKYLNVAKIYDLNYVTD